MASPRTPSSASISPDETLNAIYMKRIERTVVPTTFGMATFALCSRPLKVALMMPVSRKIM